MNVLMLADLVSRNTNTNPCVCLKPAKVSAIVVGVTMECCTFTLLNRSPEFHKKLTCKEFACFTPYFELIKTDSLIFSDDRALPLVKKDWLMNVKNIVVDNIMNQTRLIDFLTFALCSVVNLYSYCPIDVDLVVSMHKDVLFEEFTIVGVDSLISPAVMSEYTLVFLSLKCWNARHIELINDRRNPVTIEHVVHFIKNTHFAQKAHFHVQNVSGTRAQLEKALSGMKTPSKAYAGGEYCPDWKTTSYLFAEDIHVTIGFTSEEYEGVEVTRL